MDTDWTALLREAERNLAQAGAPATTPPVVEAPTLGLPHEKEIDDRLAAANNTMVIPLASGQKVRVVPEDQAALPDPEGLVRISTKTLKNLVRCAWFLKGGKVSRVVSRDQHTAETRAIVDRGEGFWASPCVFVETEKKQAPASTPSDGVVAAPGDPQALPTMDIRPFLSVSAGIVKDTVPMRLANGKVMGSLLRTAYGPLYSRNAGEDDHRLHVVSGWAALGGYTVDEEIFRKYLADPATVIKIIRGKTIYFTTSEHVLRNAGVIRSWGTEKLVMPLLGKFWIVVNEDGSPIEVGA